MAVAPTKEKVQVSSKFAQGFAENEIFLHYLTAHIQGASSLIPAWLAQKTHSLVTRTTK